MAVLAVDQIVLNPQIFKKEIRWLVVVGSNASHTRGGDDNYLRLLPLIKRIHFHSVEQI